MVGNDIIFGVAGNKKDFYIKEEVCEEEGENYDKAINAKFILSSAKGDPEGFNSFLEELLT